MGVLYMMYGKRTPKVPEMTFLPGVVVIWKSYSLNMGDKNRAEQCQKKISRETSDLPKRKTCCQVLITYRLRNKFMPKLSYKKHCFWIFWYAEDLVFQRNTYQQNTLFGYHFHGKILSILWAWDYNLYEFHSFIMKIWSK